jgi:D-alanyl-D-alanine carboxypeptidase
MLIRLLALTLVLSPVAAVAQPLPKGIEAYLAEREKQGFSGAVLVARRGEMFKRAYGLADREWAQANTTDTRFRIGSLTKQFTAAAMLLLAEQGKLSLDDPLCKHMPDCPAAWAPVRIRQLLSHSSGITDFVRLPGVMARSVLPADLEANLRLLKAQPLDFSPGSQARYGNSGYLISAWLIQKLSGKSYAAFLDEAIYRPLGMKDSGYAEDAPILARRARGYRRQRGDGTILNARYIDMTVPIGAGSQYSSVEDLYRWDRALHGEALLRPESRQAMFTPGLGGYALGWEVTAVQDRPVQEHNGDINGFGAFIARFPQDDAAIVILTNIEGTPVREMKNAIAELLFASP